MCRRNYPNCYNGTNRPQQRFHAIQSDDCKMVVCRMPIHQAITHMLITLSMVEINVGIICACLPTLRPLLIQTFPRLFSSIQSGDYFSGSSGSYPLDSSNKKRRIRSWNHLSTIGNTQLTAGGREDDCDSESARAIVVDDKNEHEQEHGRSGITKLTQTTVLYANGQI